MDVDPCHIEYITSAKVCLSSFLYLFGSSVPQLQITEELLICPLLLSPAAHGLLLFVGRLFWLFKHQLQIHL